MNLLGTPPFQETTKKGGRLGKILTFPSLSDLGPTAERWVSAH